MNKDRLETICRNAGMKPETRQRLGDHELFIADGFSLPPHNAHRRFGIGPGQFRKGMYATMWWLSRENEKLHIGSCLYFDAHHDPKLDAATKKKARINAAKKDASEHLARLKKYH